MSERKSVLLLLDITEAIQNIFDFTTGFTLESYSDDIKTRHAVEHNFMIIGEAASRLPDAFKLQNNHVSWRQVKDFRNVIVHDYFGIDNSIVWDIIQFSLPDLFVQISTLLQAENDQ